MLLVRWRSKFRSSKALNNFAGSYFDGWSWCCRKDDDLVQVEARRNCYHYSHDWYVYSPAIHTHAIQLQDSMWKLSNIKISHSLSGMSEARTRFAPCGGITSRILKDWSLWWVLLSLQIAINKKKKHFSLEKKSLRRQIEENQIWTAIRQRATDFPVGKARYRFHSFLSRLIFDFMNF